MAGKKQKPFTCYTLKISRDLWARISAEAARRTKAGVYTSKQQVMTGAIDAALNAIERAGKAVR